MVGDRAFLRVWTFESSNLLIDVLRRLASLCVVALEDFLSPSRRTRVQFDEIERDSIVFASLHAQHDCDRSSTRIEATLDVSPFDARFPRFDWGSKLAPDRTRHRRSVASRVLASYLRDVIEYPNVLTVELTVPSADVDTAFRSFCERVRGALDGIDNLSGVGAISGGGIVLPPESLAWRFEQISDLRCKFDRRYPVAFCSDGGFWISDRSLAEEVENPDIPPEKLIAPMGDKEYHDFMSKRGVFELRGGALVTGDRAEHPLHVIATDLLSATGRALCPLSNDEIDRQLGVEPSLRPHLLLPIERCAVLTQRVRAFSLNGSDSQAAIGSQLIRSLQGQDSAISDDVANVLRSLWNLAT
jgi:hypothetical protein